MHLNWVGSLSIHFRYYHHEVFSEENLFILRCLTVKSFVFVYGEYSPRSSVQAPTIPGLGPKNTGE